MKVADALQGIARLFLDTAPVIYFVERHPKYAPVVDAIFGEIDSGSVQATTSPITLAECLVVPVRNGLVTLQPDFRDLIVHGHGVTFVPIDDGIGGRAAELRAGYGLSLTDALQVAAALAAGCDALLTNDVGLKRVQELRVIVLGDLSV